MGEPAGADRGVELTRSAAARAVFLDRDGVLNRNVFYPDTQRWEAPRLRGELALCAGVEQALIRLRDAGYLLLLVSNQPNAVNGKSPVDELDAIHDRLTEWLLDADIQLDGAYYCRHHPDFTGPCVCRKPSPFLLLQAARAYALDLAHCWMIGDRVSDLQCGRAAGVRTAWVDTGQEQAVPHPGLYELAGGSMAEVAARMLALPG